MTNIMKMKTFVRVLDKDVCPQTKCVEGSNYVDVNFKIDPRTKRIIMMGAMDNLVKGAAGQAVQNMNLMFGFDEAEGLQSDSDASVNTKKAEHFSYNEEEIYYENYYRRCYRSERLSGGINGSRD